MINQEQKSKDFVQLPRKIRYEYADGKTTRHEFDVLVWIWLNANPVNGSFNTSYNGLAQDFRGGINEINARKIISSLRKKQYIYFTNHKGRGGSFPVYPVNFTLTNNRTQTFEYLKNKGLITTPSTIQIQQGVEPNHNLDARNHNLMELKQSIVKDFSDAQITTPYNDNNKKNNKYIGNKNILKNKSSSFAYKESNVIPVDGFIKKCKNYEQQKCWEIAKELGETDMRFILSCLNKYGINHVERAWGIFKEQDKTKIENPRKYFNKLIRNLAEEKERPKE